MAIRDRKQIVALASPVRLSLLSALEAVGRASVAELAAMTGMKPDGLYYHLRILEETGVIRWDGIDVVLIEKRIALAYEPKDAKNREAVSSVVAAMLRGALRFFRSGFRPPVRVSGKARELWAGQLTARLTKKQLETVNRHLAGILDQFSETPPADAAASVYTITFVLTPLRKGKG